MKDVYGNPIKAGTLIVYPSRKGSSMWLTQATVTRVNEWTETQATWELQETNKKFKYVRGPDKRVSKFSIEATRNGRVLTDVMTGVDERAVTLTRTNHILVVG